MNAAKITDIKSELKQKSNTDLIEIVLRLAKFKTENKELLTYLLFEQQNEHGYIQYLKETINERAQQAAQQTDRMAYKMLRKLQRDVNKWCRYSLVAVTAFELNLHLAQVLDQFNLRYYVFANMQQKQNEKTVKLYSKLDPELQGDYKHEMDLYLH